MKYLDKWVWITGASSGIGEALTYAFAKSGAHLIISSRNQSALERVAKNCDGPGKCLVEPLDVSAYERFTDLTERIVKKTGRIDILINNAGISQRSKVIDTDIEVDAQIMRVNFMGTIALTKAILPYMIEAGGGHFVVITSVTGMLGAPARSTYAASKHALHGFFESLLAEEYKRGIQVTMICPGYIRTNLSFNAVTGDGSPQNKMDDAQDNGMLPEVFAERAIKAISRGKNVAYIGGKEILGIYLMRFFPRILRKIVRKVNVT
jgi:short-subunit dehydrogenase